MSCLPSVPCWHAMEARSVADHLDIDPAVGLTEEEVSRRLLQHGPNRLHEAAPRPAWLRLADQFRGFLVMVLLAAAVLAGIVGDLKDAVVISVVVLINAVLGFLQEHRAEQALSALRNMLTPIARVRRSGQGSQVASQQLVPGDIVLLEAGDRVPADCRVLSAHAAEVAEAALTGESQPLGKTAATVASDSILAERSNMVFMNTMVTRGRIEAVVVATGMHTEMGHLAGLLAATRENLTPLQVQLDQLGKRLALIAAAVVALIFFLGLIRGDGLLQTAMTAIALAVAAIPEGLPAVVTVTLALGMRRMADRNVIVKKLAAVETLGCTTVICSDKTGTLTLNQMTVRRLFLCGQVLAVSGEGYGAQGSISSSDGRALPELYPLLLPVALCNDARLHAGELIGDPTEGALLALALRGGLQLDEVREHTPRLAEIPFDSAHKFMATFHYDGGRVQLWVKGAPEEMLRYASHYRSDHGPLPLDAAAAITFEAQNATFAAAAMRVLAVAGRSIAAADFDPADDLMAWVDQLTLIGLVGIVDPPRPEAQEAIRACQNAGIGVKMITGDHKATAASIANELGLDGEVHEGRELDGLDGAALQQLVERTAVFARVAPEHKMQIVKALQTQGHVVAMTGDGVNDAPALKCADIGVAMGRGGSEVSREAANLVLTDDNFASVVGAVREGRTIYDNIVKFVRFQLSTNIGAILTVLAAPLFGFPVPFTAIQILWVNIIMDGPPAISLGVEPAQRGIMREKPRSPEAPILTRSRLFKITLCGLTMAAGTLAAYGWGVVHGNQAHAMTLAFTTFVLFQFFNIFNARAEHGSAFNRHFFSNGKLWLALMGVVVLQGVIVHWAPAQQVFDTVDLGLDDWLFAVLVASSVLLLEEGRKLLASAWRRGWRTRS